MRIVSRLAVCLTFLLLAACSPAFQKIATATPSPTPQPPTLTPLPPTETPVPPTATQLPPSPTPTRPIQTAQAAVSVDAINLRQGPGTTFKITGRLSKDTPLIVQGAAHGRQWLLVDSGKAQGWLFADFLTIGQSTALFDLPLIEYKDGFVIQGRVVDESGGPVPGIGFAIFQGTGDKAPRTDAASQSDGTFFAYLPSNSTGTWSVQIVSYDCASPIMEPECKLPGSFSPTTINITLPSKDVLTYTYKK